ncbi:MAG: hypothetical protein U0892_02825 [Pirellulales bacterium]
MESLIELPPVQTLRPDAAFRVSHSTFYPVELNSGRVLRIAHGSLLI